MSDYAHRKIEDIDAISGSGTIVVDGEEHPLDADHLARVGPEHKRKVLPGADGLRVLILGGTPD